MAVGRSVFYCFSIGDPFPLDSKENYHYLREVMDPTRSGSCVTAANKAITCSSDLTDCECSPDSALCSLCTPATVFKICFFSYLCFILLWPAVDSVCSRK